MSSATSDLSGTYTLDPSHSSIGFVARHAMVTKVRGSFTDVDGSGVFDVDTPGNSKIDLRVKVASIDTRNADRDGHLRSNDFLDIENHPEIAFTSTSVAAASDDSYNVTGDLTIKGVTKPVSFDLEFTGAATDPFGNHRVGFEGQTVINRKDWGVTWNVALEAGGVLVSEKVTLTFDVSAIRTDAA